MSEYSEYVKMLDICLVVLYNIINLRKGGNNIFGLGFCIGVLIAYLAEAIDNRKN